MENQVERFDPSTLMQGVKDRIKVCPQCSIPKQLTIEHFAKDSSRASGFYHTCKSCTSVSHKKRNAIPWVRQKNMEMSRKRYSDPEVRRKKSEYATSPERQKISREEFNVRLATSTTIETEQHKGHNTLSITRHFSIEGT